MKNIFVMILALLLAGCNVTAFNVFAYDPYAAMQPTSTQAATDPARTLTIFDAGKENTPTPENLSKLDICTVTAAEALNLRSGPGTRYTVTSWLKAGETLTRLPTPPAGSWWKVTTQDDLTGWINSKYCKE